MCMYKKKQAQTMTACTKAANPHIANLQYHSLEIVPDLILNVFNFGQLKTFVYFFPRSDAAPAEGWTLDITMQKTS